MLWKMYYDNTSGSPSELYDNKVRELMNKNAIAIGKLTFSKDQVYWSEIERNSALSRLQGLTDSQFVNYSKKYGLLSYNYSLIKWFISISFLPEDAQGSWNDSIKAFSKICMNPKSPWCEFPERDEVLFNFAINKVLFRFRRRNNEIRASSSEWGSKIFYISNLKEIKLFVIQSFVTDSQKALSPLKSSMMSQTIWYRPFYLKLLLIQRCSLVIQEKLSRSKKQRKYPAMIYFGRSTMQMGNSS